MNTLKEIKVKTVLNKKKKRDLWFLDDYTFNPYSSCSFNCLYCYIRGSKYSENLEKHLSVKINAIELLEKELARRARKKEYGFIVLSSITDPYLPIEEKYQLTRQALEIILKYRFPVHIITKSNLIERDFELLKKIDKAAILPEDLTTLNRGVIISFSFSTLEEDVAKVFESGAPSPLLRLQTVIKAKESGFFTGISLMPLIPYISDTTEQLINFFSTFKKIKVDYLLPATLTLFGENKSDSKVLILKAIEKLYPDLMSKYLKFFEKNNQMPLYYQKAFYKKMKELSLEFEIPDGILKANSSVY